MRKSLVSWLRKKSPWVFHVNAGSCNNCDIEAIATLTSRFDAERFGIVLEGSPRHADVLLFTGIVTKQTAPRIKRIYEQTPNPKAVVAIGECPASGGIFRKSYNMAGPLEKIIPVNVYVLGCPPRPQAIIDGIVHALKAFETPAGEQKPLVVT